MADETPDPVASVLQRAPASQAVRASAWDAYQASSSPDDMAAKIQGLALPKEIKAQLWDLKHAASQQLVAPMNTATVNGQAVPVGGGRTWLDTLSDLLPMVGGTVGSVAGGTAGAALGGAAGEGYRELVKHAGEIPGAVADVARNLVSEPAATIRGFLEGSGKGAMAAGQEAAIQGGANVVGNVAGKAIGKGMQALAPRLMQSALKPTVSTLNEYGTTAPVLVKTLLDEGVNVTENGLTKLQKLFSANNAEIKQALVDRHDLLGRLGLPQDVIAKPPVAARALQTAGKVAEQVNPSSDLQAVGDTVGEFLNHPVLKGNLSLPEAQAMKVGTYQQIGKKYGEISSASVETQKALARGLKEDIAAEVPQITDLNARDARLMAAMDAVGRRVALAGNRDPVGFAWVAHNPVTFLAALMDRQPVVKSLLSRGLYNSAATTAKVSPQAIRLAMAAIAQGGLPEPVAAPPQ